MITNIEPYIILLGVIPIGGYMGFLSPIKDILGLSLAIPLGIAAFVLILLIIFLCIYWAKKIFGNNNQSKKIELSDTETFIILRRLNGKLIVEKSQNTYCTYSTLSSTSTKVDDTDLTDNTIYCVVCIFHNYKQINYIQSKDSEGNHFPIRTEEYTHMYANFVLFNLEENKSVRIDFK